MDIWVNVDSEGRIFCSTLDEKYADEDSIKIEVDDDFDLSKQSDYTYQGDRLVYDGKFSKEIEEKQKAEQKAIEVEEQLKIATRFLVRSQSPTMTDAQALSVSLLFPEWTVGETYSHKEIVRYNDKLYRIGQPSITASETYLPGAQGREAIYSEIEITEDGYEVWQEWDGVSGIYARDQIVKDPFDGNLYISKIPNNVYGPPNKQPDYWKLHE